MTATTLSKRQSLGSRIHDFFFAEEVPYGLALVRMTLPFGLLWAMVPRWIHAREIYSTDGAFTPLWYGYGVRELLPPIPASVAIVFATLLIAGLIAMSIGWCTRLAVPICFLTYTYLTLLDAISTMTKYSVIATHVLLLLSMSECGAVWSVDSWLRKRKARREGKPELVFSAPKSAVWPRRLIQLLIGYVYFGAAITKMHTPAFFTGDQLGSWLQTNVNYENPFGEYLSLYPYALVVSAYITIVWEILFSFLCWRGWGRVAMLTIGAGFHIMTTLMLGLYVFPMVCLAIYFAFFNAEEYRSLAVYFRRATRLVFGRKARKTTAVAAVPKFGWLDTVPSAVAFTCVMAAIALAGVELEYLIDPYGMRRPEGPHMLKELDADFVENVMMAPPVPLRVEDKINNLQAGTFFIGPTLANPRKEFRQGETMKVQCTLNLPHEDMWLECQLHDENDNVIAIQPKVSLREETRANFDYKVADTYEPGMYFLVLKCAGREVMRRTITIQSRDGRAAAN